MSFSVTARTWTSSRAWGTGSSRVTPVAVITWAPRRSAEIGRRVEPTTSQVAPASSSNSSGVPTSRALVSAIMLSSTWEYAAAERTISWPLAGTATTRIRYGMPNGRPSSSVARPFLAAAAAWAGGSSGTSRSAVGEASTIRPPGPSTCTVSVPATTGTGLGRGRFELARAATSRAPCRAVLSTPLVSVARSSLRSSIAAATRATASPTVVVTVTRARRLRLRHHRGTDSITARSCPQPPSTARRYPAPRTVCRARRPNGLSILRRR